MDSMNILVTNDDGIFSPGLAAAAEAASGFGELFIAAPSSQKTASGRSLIGGKDEFFRETLIKSGNKSFKGYHIDCTPAMVLKMAFETVFRDVKFDLAVSGINYGENIGSDVTISGTLGAAFESASTGIPAIAASLQTSISNHFHYGDEDWKAAIHFLSHFIGEFAKKKQFNGFEILKLDVPSGAVKTTGWEITRLTKKPYYRNVIENGCPSSRIADLKVRINDVMHDEGTDAHTLNIKKMVSLTPLSCDFSSARVKSLFGKPYSLAKKLHISSSISRP